ncbi:MAG: hypothetical protein Kow0037_03430 [Calditrichia bacterium]
MRILFILFIFLVISVGQAENLWNQPPKTVPEKSPKELTFIAYYFNKAVLNNMYARNDFLKGQVVGRLFGGNTTNTSGAQSLYFEQRLLPFFIYTPKLFGGLATLRTSFEIDWTWGDAAYGVGGNFGSAFSADQVNIQTQNVELELIPKKGWAINLGLQRLFDTPYNPYRTFFETMTLTGYRLAFWGSDAVGITVRRDYDYSRYKAGYYQLYENNVEQKDDVALWEAMAEFDLTPTWRQGVSLWMVQDRASGEGGVSILAQGLNSLLNDYNGVFKFNTIGADPYKADIFWLGTFWSRNAEYTLGRWGLNGFAVYNFGRVNANREDGEEKVADISGVAFNLRSGYRYGQTKWDVLEGDFIYSSGDGNGLSDNKYSGILTGNSWGSPGAIFISSGAYLLFPHGNVVNRYMALVPDLSNMGRGLVGGTINLKKAFIPNKLYGKIGGAFASAVSSPSKGGSTIGTEMNFTLGYQPGVFMNVELHGAYVKLGDFYDSPQVNGNMSQRPTDPWTIFLAFKWLMF